MKLKQILIIVALAGFLSGCNLKKIENTDNTMKATINNKKYTLEVARTEEEKRKGLGGRNTLGKNNGMIFIYNSSEYLQFWMKNTLVPLQILFVNKCEIVDIAEMMVEGDPANPQKIYKSKAAADRAIELNTNSVPENIVGQKIEQLCD